MEIQCNIAFVSVRWFTSVRCVWGVFAKAPMMRTLSVFHVRCVKILRWIFELGTVLCQLLNSVTVCSLDSACTTTRKFVYTLRCEVVNGKE